jgi:hypothetical protein
MRHLIEALSKVKLFEDRKRIMKDAMSFAHYKDTLRAVWWYNVLERKLEYSEIATTHQDMDIFHGPFTNARGWIRGRLFQYKNKYYIVVYMEDWLDHTPTNFMMADIYRQIQAQFKNTISDVVDEEGYSLTENRKKGA